MQAGEALPYEAFAPLADGVAIAVEFVGDLLVGGAVVGGGAEDEAAAKDERLRGRVGADQGVESFAEFRGKGDAGPEGTWHERPPCDSADSDAAVTLILGRPLPFVHVLAADL